MDSRMSSRSRSAGRLDINQIRLNESSAVRFDRTARNQFNPFLHPPFKFFPKRDEAQANRRIDLDQDVHVAPFSLLVAGVRPKQRQGSYWELLLQLEFRSAQPGQYFFPCLHTRLPFTTS